MKQLQHIDESPVHLRVTASCSGPFAVSQPEKKEKKKRLPVARRCRYSTDDAGKRLSNGTTVLRRAEPDKVTDRPP
jgi:hypothetical protein